MTSKSVHVLAECSKEMTRQVLLKEQGRFKYTCRDPELSDGERLAILCEEVGEVAQEMQRGARNSEMFAELVQIAAVALSWAERYE